MPTAARWRCAATGSVALHNIYGTGIFLIKTFFHIETLAGIIKPEKAGDMVKVDMGEPIFEPERYR